MAQGTSNHREAAKGTTCYWQEAAHKVEARMKAERNPDAPATVADIGVDEKEQQEEMRILIRVCNSPCTLCKEAEAHT